MQLTLLGTGCPKVDHKRFGPSNLVSSSKAHILVDCGSGVTQRLNQLKICSSKINALFLTKREIQDVNIVVNGVNLGLTFRNQFKALADKNDENIDAIISQWKSDANIY